MSKVFGRKIEVTFTNPVTGAEIIPDGDQLNIGFTVERNLDIEASTAELTIFNLRQDTQEKLKETASGWVVELAAGYFDPRATGRKPGEFGTHTIFKGDVRRVTHRREPPLLATDVEADDGGVAATKFVTKHFAKGTSIGTVFKYLQDQALPGTDPKGRNAARFTQIKTAGGVPGRLENGMTVRGYVMEELDDLGKISLDKNKRGPRVSNGVRISSQGNQLTVLAPGEALPGVPTTKISANTGLVGYPYQDAEGIVVLNHKMLPNVFPGAPLEIESEFVNLTIVVERAVYSGSLFGDDFNIEVEGRAQIQ